MDFPSLVKGSEKGEKSNLGYNNLGYTSDSVPLNRTIDGVM